MYNFPITNELKLTLAKVLVLVLTGMVFGTIAGLPGGNSEHNNNVPFNVYTYRAGQIDNMMQEVISNPTSEALSSAYSTLSLEGDWAYRQHGKQARVYESYLEACNDVRIAQMNNSPDLDSKISEMNIKKSLL